MCESGEVENEFHFIFSCTLYNNIRATLLQNIGNIIPNIRELNEVSQIKTFMSKKFVCLFAKLFKIKLVVYLNYVTRLQTYRQISQSGLGVDVCNYNII